MKYRKEVDGLRALAVVPVMFFHAGFERFRGGYVGVDVFFVISGYLITSIIVLEKEAGRFTLAGFYERRARRILPALFIVMAACVVPAWLTMLPAELKDFGQSLVTVAVYTSNFLFWRESGYFAPAAEEKPLLHTWSLAVEEQYYAVYPLMVVLLWLFMRRKGLTVFVTAVAVVSLGLAEWGWRHRPEMAFYLIPTRAWELAIGAAIALQGWSERGRVAPRWADVLAFGGLAMIGASVFAFDGRVPVPSLYTLIPTLGTGLVLVFAREGTASARLLGTPALVGIGLISYSLYLWHQPLFAFSRIFSLSRSETAVYLILMGVSGVLAWVSYHFVEKPFRDRSFLRRRTIFGLAAATSVGFIAVGTVIHLEDGFSGRLGELYAVEFREIAARHQERVDHIGTAVCHYGHDAQDVADFNAQWHCLPGNAELRVMVIGDSHAADRAMALRLNGWAVGQLSGAGCELAESRMGPRCRALFTEVPERIDWSGVDVILLVRRWQSTDVEAIDEILRYWGRFHVPLILSGPMPEYRKFETRMPVAVSRWGSRDAAGRRYAYDTRKYQAMVAGIGGAAARTGIPYIDTKAMFCSLTVDPPCSPVLGGVYLLSDETHMTVRGATLFGAKLIDRLREIAAAGLVGDALPHAGPTLSGAPAS